MSFDLFLFECNAPTREIARHRWVAHSEEPRSDQAVTEAVTELCRWLQAQWPIDLGSSAPLWRATFDIHGDAIGLSLAFEAVDVVPAISRYGAEHGFAVYDPQQDQVLNDEGWAMGRMDDLQCFEAHVQDLADAFIERGSAAAETELRRLASQNDWKTEIESQIAAERYAEALVAKRDEEGLDTLRTMTSGEAEAAVIRVVTGYIAAELLAARASRDKQRMISLFKWRKSWESHKTIP